MVRCFTGSGFLQKRREQKGLSRVETGVDIISNLPAHIIDKILSYLSLRDAVRTSILSRKWRYKWITIPNLVFDTHSIPISQDESNMKKKIVNIIDHVLLLHSGPTLKFKLSHHCIKAVPDIDRWILVLSRGSALKEFVLEIWKGQCYKIPSSLYSCKKLIHLEIFNCVFQPPLSFTGFKSLKSLDIQYLTVSQEVLEHLIASCPLLERLTLLNFDRITNLNVHAPNLLFFEVGGDFENMNFENSFKLGILSIALCTNVVNDQNPSFSCNIGNFFACLPRLRKLEVQKFFLKYLAAFRVPERLLNPCTELIYLYLSINFEDRAECNAALCIIRSSPNLQELDIFSREKENGAVASIVLEDYQDWPLTHLRLIKITGILGIAREMKFINFLLANSPFLERMMIQPASNDFVELLRMLLRLRRASVIAEIVYLDP